MKDAKKLPQNIKTFKKAKNTVPTLKKVSQKTLKCTKISCSRGTCKNSLKLSPPPLHVDNYFFLSGSPGSLSKFCHIVR